MSEFSHWKEVHPFIWGTLAKDPEICLKFLIDLFKFTIGLRVVGSEESDIIRKKSGKLLDEIRGELGVIVRDDFVVEAKTRKNVFKNM